MAGHVRRGRQLHRAAAQRQRSGGRRRHENAAVLSAGRGHVRRLYQRGHRRGAEHGGVQRLHVPHRSGAHGGRLRRAAGGAAAPVQVRGAEPAPAAGGAVRGQRHRRGDRLPCLHRGRVRRLSGGDRHGVGYGGGRAGGAAGRHRRADRSRGGHGAEKPDGAHLRPRSRTGGGALRQAERHRRGERRQRGGHGHGGHHQPHTRGRGHRRHGRGGAAHARGIPRDGAGRSGRDAHRHSHSGAHEKITGGGL